MRYFSTFSGIGGAELGIIIADPKAEFVGYSEIDRYASSVYQYHFPKHHNYGDITKIDADALPDFDLLVGGFPCQAFSIAGKRRGFEDTRGTLFFELARILRAKRPRLFLFENVKGLLSHDAGKTFRTIVATTGELGYDIQWQVLNSKHHGVPQNRERVYLVGHLRGTPRPEVFPFRQADGDGAEADAPQERILAGTLTARQYANWGGNFVAGTFRTMSNGGGKDGRGFRPTKDGMVPTLQARAREDGSGQAVIIARNQRGEVREMPISGSLTKTRSAKQFSYLLQRGRGKNKGGKHDVAPTMTGKSYQDNNHLVTGVNRPSRGYEPRKDGNACTIKAGESGTKNLVRVPEATSKGFAEAEPGDSINLAVMASKTRRGRVGKGVAQTLDTGMQQHTLTEDARIRRLTPVECERLQGFPDHWTAVGVNAKGEEVAVSDAQRYKTLGNAMTVNVIRDIMRKLV